MNRNQAIFTTSLIVLGILFLRHIYKAPKPYGTDSTSTFRAYFAAIAMIIIGIVRWVLYLMSL